MFMFRLMKVTATSEQILDHVHHHRTGMGCTYRSGQVFPVTVDEARRQCN